MKVEPLTLLTKIESVLESYLDLIESMPEEFITKMFRRLDKV